MSEEIRGLFGAPLTKATRISWDEFMRRVLSLPVEDQRKIAGKAAEVVAAAKPK